MKKIPAVILSTTCAIVLSGCFTPLSRRYSIPLHEGFFTSGEIDFPIDALGNVTKVGLVLTTITEEIYESTEINVIRDYAGNAYYEIDLTLFVSEETFDLEYDYIGTNNNQSDSYVLKSDYLSHDVIAHLVVNPNWENKDLLEHFGFRFNIYGAGDNYTFSTDLHEES